MLDWLKSNHTIIKAVTLYTSDQNELSTKEIQSLFITPYVSCDHMLYVHICFEYLVALPFNWLDFNQTLRPSSLKYFVGGSIDRTGGVTQKGFLLLFLFLFYFFVHKFRDDLFRLFKIMFFNWDILKLTDYDWLTWLYLYISHLKKHQHSGNPLIVGLEHGSSTYSLSYSNHHSHVLHLIYYLFKKVVPTEGRSSTKLWFY